MIIRAHRFHGYNSLRHVYSKGHSVRGPLFAVKSQLNSRRNTYRVAVVVSRKISKSAVKRNRMRRRIFELVRELDAGISKPYDIVITVFQEGLIDTPHKELRSQLKKQFRESGIT
jgi:ribonuclease P protein component